MAKFIKLTRLNNNYKFECMVNIDQIIYFNKKKLEEPKGTVIFISGQPERASIYVEESIEEVTKLVNGE